MGPRAVREPCGGGPFPERTSVPAQGRPQVCWRRGGAAPAAAPPPLLRAPTGRDSWARPTHTAPRGRATWEGPCGRLTACRQADHTVLVDRLALMTGSPAFVLQWLGPEATCPCHREPGATDASERVPVGRAGAAPRGRPALPPRRRLPRRLVPSARSGAAAPLWSPPQITAARGQDTLPHSPGGRAGAQAGGTGRGPGGAARRPPVQLRALQRTRDVRAQPRAAAGAQRAEVRTK